MHTFWNFEAKSLAHLAIHVPEDHVYPYRNCTTNIYCPNFRVFPGWREVHIEAQKFDRTEPSVWYTLTQYRKSDNFNLGSLRFFKNPVATPGSFEFATPTTYDEIAAADPPLEPLPTVEFFHPIRPFWTLVDVVYTEGLDDYGILILVTPEHPLATV
jgi:hypothetical protein